MKPVFGIFSAVIATAAVSCSAIYSIDQLQGPWWSNFSNPTADFAINGNLVWLDTDSRYHPCRIDGDRLIFDLGGGQGPVVHKIVSIDGDALLLEHMMTNTRIVYTRVKPKP